jgi:hypothetical protein
VRKKMMTYGAEIGSFRLYISSEPAGPSRGDCERLVISRTFYFKKEIFGQCFLKSQCTKQERRTVTIGKHHNLIMGAKEYN